MAPKISSSFLYRSFSAFPLQKFPSASTPAYPSPIPPFFLVSATNPRCFFTSSSLPVFLPAPPSPSLSVSHHHSHLSLSQPCKPSQVAAPQPRGQALARLAVSTIGLDSHRRAALFMLLGRNWEEPISHSHTHTFFMDPCIKDERELTPYMLASDKEVRNTFRRFMASNPDKWDWNAAKVPSPLTKELEESQAAKQAEKDAKRKARAKELKKLRKEKEKKA